MLGQEGPQAFLNPIAQFGSRAGAANARRNKRATAMREGQRIPRQERQK